MNPSSPGPGPGAREPQSVRDHAREELLTNCREILAPLVHADGGEMFLVAASADTVHIHLSGACSGCPGASITRDHVLAPVVQTSMPKARLVVTTGLRAPEGATKIEPAT